jgi:hypothetical protein
VLEPYSVFPGVFVGPPPRDPRHFDFTFVLRDVGRCRIAISAFMAALNVVRSAADRMGTATRREKTLMGGLAPDEELVYTCSQCAGRPAMEGVGRPVRVEQVGERCRATGALGDWRALRRGTARNSKGAE